VRAVDDVRDFDAVGVAHDGVGGSVQNQDGHIYGGPGFAEIQILKLLVKLGGAAVLAVGFVVPECSPLRMVLDDFAGNHFVDQEQRIKVRELF